MAGDWMPLDHDLPEKPEVAVIAERTDCDIPTIIGRLFMFWRWADSQTVDGQLTGLTIKSLANRCGGTEPFWQAVEAAGWLEVTPEGLAVPRFTERFGESAKRRKMDATRKRLARRLDTIGTEAGQVEDQQSQSQSQSKKSGSGSGVFKSISEPVLRDTGKLRVWFEWQSAEPYPVLSVTDLDWLRAVSAAEHALAKGRHPVRLFVSTVGCRKWDRISNAAEDRARGRIRAWESERKSGPPALGGVPLPDLGADRD